MVSPEISERSRPPIIIFDIDTLRAGHLGSYGYSRDTSPNIDRFARESVQFDWSFGQAPNTPPSQASIFTSLYPTVHGRIRDEEILPDRVVTLAESLSAAGYSTAGIVDGGLMAGEFGLAQGFDTYDDQGGGVAKIGPKARAWLQEHASEQFFLLIHSYDVHSPYERTPEPFRSRFLEGIDRPSVDFMEHMTQRMEERRLSRYGENPHRLTEIELEYAKALYDGGITHIDSWFGDFIDFLRVEGIYDRALLVFLSDHGEEFEEHDSVFHERLYSTVTRVPLMIRFPGGQPVGRISEAVEMIDLMPTILAQLGLPAPREAEGQNLLPLIQGTGAYRDLAISESPFFGRRIAVTTASHRLFYTVAGEGRELYDYRNDPFELVDLAAAEPEIAEHLVRTAERWEELVSARSQQSEVVTDMKQETIEQLRTLGYLD
ncbi:MAG: sulfatase [Thermoanaerobaculia bacterium]|nr:sulfatase [Thermoanaerobaculia bacterium]